MYGGASAQYPMYGSGSSGGLVSGGATAAAAAAYYPYLNFSDQGSGGGAAGGYSASHGYGVQYPHHLYQGYSSINSAAVYPPHYGTPVSLAPPTPLQSAGFISIYTIIKYNSDVDVDDMHVY